LIATKSDLLHEREISTEEGMALGMKFGIKFAEVSARTNSNVKEAFELLVKEIHKKFDSGG
jgi:GTPase SAR1 family protein